MLFRAALCDQKAIEIRLETERKFKVTHSTEVGKILTILKPNTKNGWKTPAYKAKAH